MAEKEVTPEVATKPVPKVVTKPSPKAATQPVPKMAPEPAPKATPQKIKYKSADKESFSEIINQKFPKELIPSKRINAIFGIIFVVVLVISAMQFPFTSVLSGNTDVAIEIGFPLHFLELRIADAADSSPLLLNLLIDLFLYLILAYAIDVSLGLIIRNPLVGSKEQVEQRPVIFKDRKPTIAEKVTEKVFEKEKQDKTESPTGTQVNK